MHNRSPRVFSSRSKICKRKKRGKMKKKTTLRAGGGGVGARDDPPQPRRADWVKTRDGTLWGERTEEEAEEEEEEESWQRRGAHCKETALMTKQRKTDKQETRRPLESARAKKNRCSRADDKSRFSEDRKWLARGRLGNR